MLPVFQFIEVEVIFEHPYDRKLCKRQVYQRY